MINTCIIYSGKNTAATSGITKHAIVMADVKAKMVLINSSNIIAGGTSTGVTLDTKALRIVMEGLAFKCARGTLAFANSKKDNTLKAKVNYSESALKGTKKEDIDDVCEGIQIATKDNILDVVSYGVVATDPTDLLTAINLYRTATQNPRNAIISKSQANVNSSKMIREVINDLFIGQIDVMVDTLKLSNNAYWKGWKQAREIIDLGKTTAKVRGTVIDELDVPKSNVKFSILKAGTDAVVMTVITDAKGKFNAPNVPVGDYDFVWMLDGFENVTEKNVHVSAGKELKRKIVMKKV